MKNKYIKTVLLIIILLISGCGNSWKSKFQVSNLKIDDDYIVGKIKNTTDKAYNLNIIFNLKSGSLTEKDNCHMIIKPHETKKIDCISMDHDGYKISVSNIEFKEKEIPELINGTINKETLEYHFEKIYETHRYNFTSFSLISDEEQKEYPFIDTIKYDEQDNTIEISGKFTNDNEYFNYREKYDTKTDELKYLLFYIKTTDEELRNSLLTKVSLMKSFRDVNSLSINKALHRDDVSEDKCILIGGKWCVSSSVLDKEAGIISYHIYNQNDE